MVEIDERLLDESPLLRKKIWECRRMARDLRITLAFEQSLREGGSYCQSLAEASLRFSASVSTVKRAVRKMRCTPFRRRRTLRELATLKSGNSRGVNL